MPLSIDAYLGVQQDALKVQSKRMEVLAKNLANADTPNYKAQDLDFRTAPVGSMSARAALFETSVYTMTNLALAWGVGWTIGTGIHWAIQTYTPTLDNKIGAAVDRASASSFHYLTGFWPGKKTQDPPEED